MPNRLRRAGLEGGGSVWVWSSLLNTAAPFANSLVAVPRTDPRFRRVDDRPPGRPVGARPAGSRSEIGSEAALVPGPSCDPRPELDGTMSELWVITGA
ncbi:hypothetical protein GCM10014715_70950 [Streptomyces spiralis]|uniref:Uncharacterized protein n=1 Tax=Streptomyces spiralis TaxID=66376 RepID=A0A919AGG3_9ACTN|nr:hypothetical protein GCM10014715_70950 [Streptomyces spiralis]